MAENNLILNDALLNLTKKIFYYGSYSAADFEKEKISKKVSFDQYRQELTRILGNWAEEVPDTTPPALHFNPERTDKILTELSLLEKISDDDLALFLILLDIFADKEENWLSCSALSAKIKEYTDNTEFSDTAFLKKKLEYFVSQGYFISRKNGRSFEYSQPVHIWESLTKHEQYLLVSLLEFSSNVIPLSGIWKSYKDIIKIYNKKANYNFSYDSFECRHYHFGQILEENNIWTLITAVYYQKNISFKTISGKKKTHIQPYRIIVQEETGDRYLFGIDLENGNSAVLCQICDITELKTEKSGKISRLSEEEAEKLYHSLLDNSFSGTVLAENTLQTAHLVYATDFSDEIQRRFPDAQSQHYDDTHDTVQIEVTSLQELKPWIRRNMDKVCLKNCSDDTADQLQVEMEEWRAMYGIK